MSSSAIKLPSVRVIPLFNRHHIDSKVGLYLHWGDREAGGRVSAALYLLIVEIQLDVAWGERP